MALNTAVPIVKLGDAFLAFSLLLNLYALGTLGFGTSVVPQTVDAALVEAELWGFAANALAPTTLHLIVPFVGLGAAWFKLLGVVLVLDGLKIYRVPARPSTLPAISEPVRRWVRMAFVWLLVASLIGAMSALLALPAGLAGATSGGGSDCRPGHGRGGNPGRGGVGADGRDRR